VDTLVALGVGVLVGAAADETVRRVIGGAADAVVRPTQQRYALNGVYAQLDKDWEGGSRFDDESGYQVDYLTARILVCNRSGQIIRNVAGDMHERPGGESTQSLDSVAGLPSGEDGLLTFVRDVGIADDHPHEVDMQGFEALYWFSLTFDDARGARWLIDWNPRERSQRIMRHRR
jgi:hypothetical protein